MNRLSTSLRSRLPGWVTREIRVFKRPPRAPRPWERKLAKGLRVLVVVLASVLVVWRVHLAWQVNRRLAAIRASLLTMAVRTIERSLNRMTSGSFSDRLISSLSAAVNTNALQRALIGERAMAIPVFRMSRAEVEETSAARRSEDRPLAGRPSLFHRVTGFGERELNFYLQAMETNIWLAGLPPPASLVATNVAEQFDAIAGRFGYFFSKLLLLSYAGATVRDAEVLACLRLAQAAIAVERFRSARGRLPDAWGELIPQHLTSVPIDPFNDAPLRYRRSERGYVVYSVDADGHDDAGRPRPERRKPTDISSYDLTFTVERVTP